MSPPPRLSRPAPENSSWRAPTSMWPGAATRFLTIPRIWSASCSARTSFPREHETTEARSQHLLGIALVVAAAVFWSTAPFFTRLLAYDSWTILFWHGLFAGAMITVLMVFLQGRGSLRDLVRFDINGWLVASFSTLAMIAFIPSLQLTDVSNVAIIVATGPFLAAGLAWIWLKEIPHRRTMLASAVALVGVVIIVGGARAGSDVLGAALAIFMALAIAAMTVMVRRHRNTPMIAAAALSNFLAAPSAFPSPTGLRWSAASTCLSSRCS